MCYHHKLLNFLLAQNIESQGYGRCSLSAITPVLVHSFNTEPHEETCHLETRNFAVNVTGCSITALVEASICTGLCMSNCKYNYYGLLTNICACCTPKVAPKTSTILCDDERELEHTFLTAIECSCYQMDSEVLEDEHGHDLEMTPPPTPIF